MLEPESQEQQPTARHSDSVKPWFSHTWEAAGGEEVMVRHLPVPSLSIYSRYASAGHVMQFDDWVGY